MIVSSGASVNSSKGGCDHGDTSRDLHKGNREWKGKARPNYEVRLERYFDKDMLSAGSFIA